MKFTTRMRDIERTTMKLARKTADIERSKLKDMSRRIKQAFNEAYDEGSVFELASYRQEGR